MTHEATSVIDERTIETVADDLLAVVRGYGKVAAAFSGGVDSSVVAMAAKLALGENAIAVTGTSDSLAEGELTAARQLADFIGIRHEILSTDEFSNPDYVRNDGTRCYHCKSELYEKVESLRQRLGFDVICSGANLEDLGDYRPGLRAAAERHVRHPLVEAKLTKKMVRDLATLWGLPNWDKPASPCLSSRIAVGVEATPERTRRVDQAETFLRSLGFTILRVRYHADDHARIEVSPEEIAKFLDTKTRMAVVECLRSLGFLFVSLDLEGFRSGGLNVLLPTELLGHSSPGIGKS